jgi:plastocyanin
MADLLLVLRWSLEMTIRYFFQLVSLTIGCLTALNAMAGPVSVNVNDGAGKPIADAVVFLESAAAKSAIKAQEGIEVAQELKQFVPSVTVVPIGSLVRFPNRDTVRHHVYSFSTAKKFELKLYTGTPANPVLFDRAGVVVLGCNIHDHMAAWVVVVETPYFGKTNVSGEINLGQVPPGSYKLRTWHSGFSVGASAQEQPLIVASSNVTNAVVKVVLP